MCLLIQTLWNAKIVAEQWESVPLNWEVPQVYESPQIVRGTPILSERCQSRYPSANSIPQWPL